MNKKDATTAINRSTCLDEIFDLLQVLGCPMSSNVRYTVRKLLAKQVFKTSEVMISYGDTAAALRSIRCLGLSNGDFVFYSFSIKGVGLVATPLWRVSVQNGLREIGYRSGDLDYTLAIQKFLKGTLGIDKDMFSMHGIVINIQPLLREQQSYDIYEN